MVQNVWYSNGLPSHVTLPFEYHTPIFSGIQKNPVLLFIIMILVQVNVVLTNLIFTKKQKILFSQLFTFCGLLNGLQPVNQGRYGLTQTTFKAAEDYIEKLTETQELEDKHLLGLSLAATNESVYFNSGSLLQTKCSSLELSYQDLACLSSLGGLVGL